MCTLPQISIFGLSTNFSHPCQAFIPQTILTPPPLPAPTTAFTRTPTSTETLSPSPSPTSSPSTYPTPLPVTCKPSAKAMSPVSMSPQSLMPVVSSLGPSVYVDPNKAVQPSSSPSVRG
eukprot:1325746-Amorphochlora_amoeboformis.AAC.1